MKEILKEKRLNEVFPFPDEIVSVLVINNYLLKNIQFVFKKRREAIKGYIIGVLGFAEDIILGYKGDVI